MNMVKVPITNALLLQLLHLDRDKYQIHTVATSSENPLIVNVYVTGDDLPELKDRHVIPEAMITVTTEVDNFGNRKYESSIDLIK